MIHKVGGKSIELMQGDITTVPVDAIANAANSALAGGGGVDGAIHEEGGPAIMSELKAIRAKTGGCPAGSAVATSAGDLPARLVFHAVGPRYRGGQSGESEQLASAYRSCLRLAEEHGVTSMSFPSISTGVYGYPVEEAAAIALRTIEEGLAGHRTLERVVFVLYDVSTFKTYSAALEALRGVK